MAECCGDIVIYGKQAKFEGSELVLIDGAKTLSTFCLCDFNKQFTDSKILEFVIGQTSSRSIIDTDNESYTFIAISVSYETGDDTILYQEKHYEEDLTPIADGSLDDSWVPFNKLLIKDVNTDLALSEFNLMNPNSNDVTVKIILLK